MSDGPDERNDEPDTADDESDRPNATGDESEEKAEVPESEHSAGTESVVSREPRDVEREPRQSARSESLQQDTQERAIDPQKHTTDRRSLAADVQIQWGIKTTFAVVVVTLIAAAILGTLELDIRYSAVVLVGFFLLGTALVVARYRRWVYQVREDALYLERGVIVHVRTLVPYVRIQHVDTSRGPLERVLGLSTLVVYTAGSRGADVSIPGLTPEQARDLQKRVKELAIEAEGGDAV